MSNKVREAYLELIVFIILSILSFCFLAFFSYYTSPFTVSDNGYDAAFFRLVGQGMTKGYLPYRDFFDMKGPFLFLIEYVGQLLSYGRKGIFIIQCINLSITLFICTKILQLFQIKNGFIRIILILPLLFVAGFTFEGGNLTEEFSLVPLFSCLYLYILFITRDNDKKYQKKICLFAGGWFGFCFGILLMIRVTNAAFLGAMAFVVVLSLIIDHKGPLIGICIGTFIIGLLLAISPALIFFGVNGLMDEMIEAMFVLGYKYSEEKTILQHITEVFTHVRRRKLLLVIIPCLLPIILRWRSSKERGVMTLGALFTFLAVISGNNYTHYYTLTLPLVLLSIIVIVDCFIRKKLLKAITALVLVCTMLVPQFSILKQYYQKGVALIFHQEQYNTYETIQDIAARIPDEDSQSVYCYNLNPAWYTYADLFPCIKYCGWQNHYFALMSEIFEDFQILFIDHPPRWFILPIEQGELPQFLENEITNHYYLVYQNSKYMLFRYIENSVSRQ